MANRMVMNGADGGGLCRNLMGMRWGRLSSSETNLNFLDLPDLKLTVIRHLIKNTNKK